MIISTVDVLKHRLRFFSSGAARLIGCAVVVLATATACTPHATPPPPKPPSIQVLRVRHQVGGTHYRTLVHQGIWYQTYGSTLLVVDPTSAAVLKEIKLGKPGEVGPAIDLAVSGTRLFAVIEDDAVIELNIEEPRNPRIVGHHDAEQLGVSPHNLSVVNDEVFISGRGGVVRARDGRKIFSTTEMAGRVAQGEGKLVVCVGRQVIDMATGLYVGSATDLQNIPPGMARAGELVFVRQNDDAALAGLMTPNIREVNSSTGTVGVPGIARAVRLFAGQMWVVNDSGVSAYQIEDQSLALTMHINILGARDVAPLSESTLAIAGTFGRAIYTINSADATASDHFSAVVREAGLLDSAVTDGRHVLAGSVEGNWMYLINSRAEMVTQPMKATPAPAQHATTVDGSARIIEGGQAVLITRANWPELRHTEHEGALIRCVAAIDGDFWLGTDRGITVIRGAPILMKPESSKSDTSAQGMESISGQVRIPGPVTYIFPLLVGGGASFVSQNGGFGVVQFVEEPIGVVNPTR